MATKTKHDLLIEKIRKRYEGNTPKVVEQTPDEQQTQPPSDVGEWIKWIFEDTSQNPIQKLVNINSRLLGNVGKAVIKGYEGLADTATSLVGSGLEAVGLDEASKAVHEFGKRDLTTEMMTNSDYMNYIGTISGNIGPIGEFSKILGAYKTIGNIAGTSDEEFYQRTFGTEQYLPEIAENLSTGAGQMLGMMAGGEMGAGLLGKAGQYVTVGAMAGGQSYEQALNEGATGYQATAYGLASGSVEAVSEAFVGNIMKKIGLGTGGIAGFGGSGGANPAKTQLGTAVVNILKNSTEEGVEEVFSELMNPILQMYTYRDDVEGNFFDKYSQLYEENGGHEALIESFVLGAILAGGSGTLTTVSGAKQLGSLEAYNLQQEIESLSDINTELEKLYKSNNADGKNNAKIQRQLEKRKKVYEQIQNKYKQFLEDVESNKIEFKTVEDLKRLVEESNDPNTLSQKLNRQAIVEDFEAEAIRDIRQKISQDIANVAKTKVDVLIGEVEQAENGKYKKIKGSYYDEKTGRIVLKSSQIMYNKIAEVLGHELKHVLESKELTDTLLEDLSEAEYKRLYNDYFKAYSQVADFSQLSEEAQQEYIRQEISADILGSMFDNLGQMERAFKKMDAKGLNRLMYNVRSLFESNRRRFKNYNKVMEALEKARNNYIEKHGAETTEETETMLRYKIAKKAHVNLTKNQQRAVLKELRIFAEKYDMTLIQDKIVKSDNDLIYVSNYSIDDNNVEHIDISNKYELEKLSNKGFSQIEIEDISNIILERYYGRTSKGRKTKISDIVRDVIKERLGRQNNVGRNVQNGVVGQTDSRVVSESNDDTTPISTTDGTRNKLDNASDEYVSEEYALGTDEYGSKRLVERAENPRYSIEPKTVQIDDDFDGSKGYKVTLENDEYKIKGLDWYEQFVDKRDEIETKYDDGEISETAYENRLDKINEKVQEAVDELEGLLQALEDYDLEDMEQYETVPTPKQIEKIINYAYNIQILVGDEFPNVTVDFEMYLDEDSKINELYSYVSQPKQAVTEQATQEETKVEKITEEKQYATVAPYYSKEVSLNTIEETNKEIKEKFYSKATEIAKAFGIKITNMDTNMGGFEFQEGENKGKSVNEISYTFELEGCADTEADLFASLMGDLGHENQEAVIAMNYLETDANADIIEFEIAVNDLNQLEKVLKTASIKDYTINIDKKTIKILDFSNGSPEFLSSYDLLINELTKGNNIYGQKGRKISSRYLDRESRRNTYEVWLAENGNGKREGNGNIHSEKGQSVSESLEEQKTLIKSAIEELYKVSLKHQQDVKQEADESIKNEQVVEEQKEPIKHEKSERAIALENTLKETLSKHTETEDITTDVSDLFTEEQLPKVQEALDYMVNGWMVNRERFNGLDFFYRNLTRKQTTAKSMCVAVEDVLGKIEEIYAIIEENAPPWMKNGELEKLEKALELVYNLCDLTVKMDGYIDEDFDNRSSVDEEFNYETISDSLMSFIDDGSKYYKLIKNLESKIQAVKNGQIRNKSVNVNRGTEAKTYGSEQRTFNIERKVQSTSNISSQDNGNESTETQSNSNSSQEQNGQVLPTSSVGTVEESKDESSGVHTDSETVVEQETSETAETVEQTTEEQTETPTEIDEVDTESTYSVKTVSNKAKIKKEVAVQIRSVIIKNTRYKSPKDNVKTLKWGAHLYNKKVYDKINDAKALRERIAKYLHKERSQSFVVEGKGAEMLEYEITAVLNSLDRNLSVEKKIDAIYKLVENHITKPNKAIEKAIKKFIKNTIENGGEKSRMVKLIESSAEHTTKRVTEKYENEIQDAYERLQQALDMVEVYQETINDLNQQLEAIKTDSEANATENKKKINQLSKIINSLTAECKKLLETKNKNDVKVKELKQSLKELKSQLKTKTSEVNKLTKKLKQTSTSKTTISTSLHGKKVINHEFRKGLDAIDFSELADDGFTIEKKQVDNDLYNQIAHRISVGDFDGAIEKYLKFVGELKVTDADGNVTKLDDGSQEWKEFAKQIEQFFKDFYFEAETSTAQELKDKAKHKEALMKGVISLIKSSYAIKNKIKKNKGVVQTISAVASNLVKGIAKPSITNLKNGTYRAVIKEAYEQLTKKVNGKTILEDIGYEFEQDVLDMMNEIANGKGELTVEEIQKLTKVMRYMSKFLTKSAGGKVHDGMTDRQRAIESIKKQKSLGEHQRWVSFLQALSPRVVMKYMDQFEDGINTYIYNKLLEGESVEQETFVKLFGIMKNFYKTDAGKQVKKNINKKVTIKYVSKGQTKTITATVGEFVSIWKLLQREDSRAHIANSGFTTADKKGRLTEFRFNTESLKSFKEALDGHFEFSKPKSIYGQYIAKTTEFFEMARDLKIMTDESRLGYSNVLENEEYFPIKVVAHDRLMQLGENTDYMRTSMQGSRNYSWNASVEGLKGMLEISSVEQVIQIYSTQMARYVGYAEIIDTINTIFNYQIQGDDVENGLYKGETLRNVMGKRFGAKNGKSNALGYYNKLLKDVQGIRNHDDGILEKFRSNFALYQLGANLKVMANQLSALPTAIRYLGLGNYLKAHKTLLVFGFNVKVEDMPYTAQYRIMEKSMIDAQTLTDKGRKVAELFGKGMTFTDNLVIKTIWTACMMQTNNNKTEATELFDKIIRETQGFNTLQRSGLLRSDNTLIKQMMMFTIQPSHNLSNIMEYALHAFYSKKTGTKITGEQRSVYIKSIVGIALEGAMYTAISLLFKYLLDKDEEDEYEIENILESYFNDNIIGMIPFLNNIEVDFQAKNGKFIQFNDFNLGAISQVYEAFEEVQNVFTAEDPLSSFKSLMYSIGMLTGIPTRNMNNYGTMILKTISPDVAYEWEIRSSGKSLYNKEIVNTALDKRQMKKAWNYYKAYNNNIVELDDETMKFMFNMYSCGYTGAYIKQIPTILDTEDETIVVDREKFVKTYSQVSMALKKLVSNPSFLKLSDLKKEKMIKKIVNYYYQLAYKEQSGEKLTNIEHLIKEEYLSVKTLVYLNEIANIEETDKMTRKEAIQKYINKLPISRQEKFVLYFLAGYKLPEDKQRLVKNFLKRNGVSNKTLNAMFE